MRHERIHLQWLKKGENNCRVMQIVCPLTTKNLLQTQFFSNAPRCFVACNHIGCGYMLHIWERLMVFEKAGSVERG
jgi:hypothetical protein